MCSPPFLVPASLKGITVRKALPLFSYTLLPWQLQGEANYIIFRNVEIFTPKEIKITRFYEGKH
jgi:hypothetical protein